MENFTKIQRIAFAAGLILSCGVPNRFQLINIHPVFAGFLQGFGIGLMLAVLFKKKIKERLSEKQKLFY